MTNLYNSIIRYEDDEWSDYLDKICLYEVFKELFDIYPDSAHLKCAIRYIVWTYSVDSEKILLGIDWLKNKKMIFEESCVMPSRHMEDQLIYLKDERIIDVINKWLQLQDSDVFQQLSLLKDLRLEMQRASVGDILKATGEKDYKAKYDCATYAIELKNKIKDLEAELIQNNVKLKDAVREVKTMKAKTTISVEQFAK